MTAFENTTPLDQVVSTSHGEPSKRRIPIGLIALILKAGPKLWTALSGLVKGLKVGKAGLATASVASYSLLFSWQFALLIMIALFVHESGHLWAMKRCGLKTKGMYFIPFIGAAAVPDDEFPSRGSESFIALMGPIWGLALAALVGAAYFVTHQPLFAAASAWMAGLNLFNLLPVLPLDGGRVFKSVAFSSKSRAAALAFILCSLGLGFLAGVAGLHLFFLLLIIGGIEIFFEYKRQHDIPKMSKNQRALSVLIYVFLTGVLWALMSYMAHVPDAEIAMKLFKGI